LLLLNLYTTQLEKSLQFTSDAGVSRRFVWQIDV
jgi:hypothetical protein